MTKLPILLLAAALGAPAASAQQLNVFATNGLPSRSVDIEVNDLPFPLPFPIPLAVPVTFAETQFFGLALPAVAPVQVRVFFRPDTTPALTGTLPSMNPADISVIPHLDAAGQPALATFVEDPTPRAFNDQAGFTVRNLAAFDFVDVTITNIGGVPVTTLSGIANGSGQSIDLPAGDYRFEISTATGTVVLPSTPIVLDPGRLEIVSFVGSLSLGLAASTTELDRRQVVTVTGTGCAGVGSFFDVETSGPTASLTSILGLVPETANVVLNVGFAPISFDLTGLGATGCVLGTAPVGTLPVPVASGIAISTLNFPRSFATFGSPSYFQFIFSDESAPLGIGVSATARIQLN